MITTGCEECRFLKRDESGKGCSLGQFCLLQQDGRIIAPGYCRMCRSHKWAKKHQDDLYSVMMAERTLRMDIIVFFDEAVNSLADLKHTLDSNWYTNYTSRVIIADVTGFGDRKNLALQYIKGRNHRVSIIVDSSRLHECIEHREETIRRLVGQVKSPFFLAIPAGLQLSRFHKFAQDINYIPTRVIHWSFPLMANKTVFASRAFIDGLFITRPYRALTKHEEAKPFSERITKEEIETKISLSWQCESCWMI